MAQDELISKEFQRKLLLNTTLGKISEANEDITVAASRKLHFRQASGYKLFRNINRYEKDI
jgi:hypothetical protein